MATTRTQDPVLVAFLRDWLGAWPAAGTGLDVVGEPARTGLRWDGGEQLVIAVTEADGRGVLSVPPHAVGPVRKLVAAAHEHAAHEHATHEHAADPDAADRYAALRERLPMVVGRPAQSWFSGVFRWTTRATPLPDAGEWEPASGADIPPWLRPFGRVLAARDPSSGAFLAGVGLKHHNSSGVEISVGTESAARGRGLARRLVAQAARQIVAAGAVPIYLHDPRNVASARVAEAAGFTDHGWQVHGIAAQP